MIDRVHELISQYRAKGVILDANLLMLLLVGSYNRARIPSFKRTKRYIEDDYDILRLIIDPFKKFVTTPAILVEISNLTGAIDSHFDAPFFELFREYVQNAYEVYIPSVELMEISEWLEFGLTDIGMIQAARQHEYLIITDDMRLHALLELAGMDVIGFSNVRGYIYD